MDDFFAGLFGIVAVIVFFMFWWAMGVTAWNYWF